MKRVAEWPHQIKFVGFNSKDKAPIYVGAHDDVLPGDQERAEHQIFVLSTIYPAAAPDVIERAGRVAWEIWETLNGVKAGGRIVKDPDGFLSPEQREVLRHRREQAIDEIGESHRMEFRGLRER